MNLLSNTQKETVEYETCFTRQIEERREALKDFFGGDDRDEIPDELLQRIFQFEELMVKYRSAIREVTTKLEILGDDYPHLRTQSY